MDDSVSISEAGHRAVVKNSPLSRYMKAVPCDITPFKMGDTFYTVGLIKKWVETRAHHTADLAPHLRGKTLKQTADNIYQFLYKHIQYKADAEMQNLLSPGCAWNKRFEGLDCKSFSIFASSILTNLGIQHAIRQVRQPYYYPDQFTHVYVVIPADQSIKELRDQKTYVIDGTRHENKEVMFTEKKDILMLPHQGLGAAKPSKTLCSFAGKSLKNSKSKAMRSSAGRKLVSCRGLNGATQEESNYKQAVLATKLNAIVNKLAGAGVPAEQCKKIQKKIMGYWLKNQDPMLKITPQGFTVQGEYIPFFPAGLGRAALPALDYDFTGINPGPAQQKSGGLDLGSLFGGGGSLSSLFGSGSGVTPSGGSGGGGIGISGLASGAANALIPGVGLALGPILSGLDLDKNFNNVLKYGLNSWGASTDPEIAKKEFATGVIPEVKKYIDLIRKDPDKGLDQLQIYLDVGKAYYTVLRTEHSKANSTKAANDFFIDQFKKLQSTTIDKIISQLKSQGVEVTESVNSNPTGSFSYPTNNETFSSQKIMSDPKLPSIFKAYSLSASQALIDKATANAQPDTPATPGNDNYQTANPGSNYAPGQANAPGVQKAGFPWLPAIAIAGAGGSALYFANKGKSKSKK